MATHVPHLVSALRFYRVRPTAPVTVQVLIGDGQAGGTVLHWEDGSLSFPGEDQATHTVGERRDLTNTFLDCTTTVRDIREETNHTSVTIRLDGGVEPAEFAFEHEVEEAGIVIYAIEFFFTS
jgi:hypothetical protein